VIFYDTETHRLGPKREIWNIGAIVRGADGSQKSYDLIIRDVDMTHADPKSLEMNHFHERHPEYGGDPGNAEVVTEAEAAAIVEEWTRPVDGRIPHVVGAVPNFDTEVSEKMLSRHGRVWGGHYHLLDTENLTLGFLLGAGFFTAWEAFLQDRIRPLLPFPDAGITAEHRARMIDGQPMVEGWFEHVDYLPVVDLPRLATVLGRPVTEKDVPADCELTDAVLPYFHPGPPWSADKLTCSIGVEPATPELRHTALGDADWCMRTYDRLMEFAPAVMRPPCCA
jgi:hypothetical protein